MGCRASVEHAGVSKAWGTLRNVGFLLGYESIGLRIVQGCFWDYHEFRV